MLSMYIFKEIRIVALPFLCKLITEMYLFETFGYEKRK